MSNLNPRQFGKFDADADDGSLWRGSAFDHGSGNTDDTLGERADTYYWHAQHGDPGGAVDRTILDKRVNENKVYALHSRKRMVGIKATPAFQPNQNMSSN